MWSTLLPLDLLWSPWAWGSLIASLSVFYKPIQRFLFFVGLDVESFTSRLLSLVTPFRIDIPPEYSVFQDEVWSYISAMNVPQRPINTVSLWRTLVDDVEAGLLNDNKLTKPAGMFAYKPSQNTSQMIHWIWNGTTTMITISSKSADSVHQGAKLNTMSLSTQPWERETLYAFIEQVWRRSKSRRKKQLCINRWSDYRWKERLQVVRGFDTLFFHDAILNLVQDAKVFLSPDTRTWYEDHGIPYRRGYLLHGEPGCGKSSFISALAGVLDADVYIIPNESNISRCLDHIPQGGRTMLVFEDIDGMVKPTKSMKPNEGADLNNVFADGEYPQIAISSILNLLDGLTSIAGTVVIATTNHIDRLDPALKRAGRMDRICLFPRPSDVEINRMCSSLFTPTLWEKQDVQDIVKEACKTMNFATIQACAQRMMVEAQVTKQPLSTWSAAQVQEVFDMEKNNRDV